jgi:hypothetical protein
MLTPCRNIFEADSGMEKNLPSDHVHCESFEHFHSLIFEYSYFLDARVTLQLSSFTRSYPCPMA